MEAGGQCTRGFRRGLDYAFIRLPGCGAFIRCRILVLAPCGRAVLGESMSLYRAGLRLALFLPLGVTMPPSQAPSGFTDVSSVFHSALTSRRDP